MPRPMLAEIIEVAPDEIAREDGAAEPGAPPPLPSRFTRREHVFASALEKAQWIAGRAKLDAERPTVIAFAAYVCGRYFRSSPLHCALMLHRYVRDRIEWIEDNDGVETLEDPEVTLARGYNDCDGKARLFVSMAIAAGIEAEIRPIFLDLAESAHEPEEFSHVQARARLPGSDRLPYAEPGGWLVVELTLRDVPFGAGAESRSEKEYA